MWGAIGEKWFEVLLRTQDSLPVFSGSKGWACSMLWAHIYPSELSTGVSSSFSRTMPTHPSRTRRATTLCITLLPMGTGSAWNWWVLPWEGSQCWDWVCMCQGYQLPSWLLLDFFGEWEICENLQHGAVNSNICTKIYLKNMSILIIKSLFNNLMHKGCLQVEFMYAQINFKHDQNIPSVCLSARGKGQFLVNDSECAWSTWHFIWFAYWGSK